MPVAVEHIACFRLDVDALSFIVPRPPSPSVSAPSQDLGAVLWCGGGDLVKSVTLESATSLKYTVG